MALKVHTIPRYVFIAEDKISLHIEEGTDYIVINTEVTYETFVYSWGEFPTGGSEERLRPVITHTLRRL